MLTLELSDYDATILRNVLDEKIWRVQGVREERLATESKLELAMGYEPFLPNEELQSIIKIREQLDVR